MTHLVQVILATAIVTEWLVPAPAIAEEASIIRGYICVLSDMQTILVGELDGMLQTPIDRRDKRWLHMYCRKAEELSGIARSIHMTQISLNVLVLLTQRE